MTERTFFFTFLFKNKDNTQQFIAVNDSKLKNLVICVVN